MGVRPEDGGSSRVSRPVQPHPSSKAATTSSAMNQALKVQERRQQAAQDGSSRSQGHSSKAEVRHPSGDVRRSADVAHRMSEHNVRDGAETVNAFAREEQRREERGGGSFGVGGSSGGASFASPASVAGADGVVDIMSGATVGMNLQAGSDLERTVQTAPRTIGVTAFTTGFEVVGMIRDMAEQALVGMADAGAVMMSQEAVVFPEETGAASPVGGAVHPAGDGVVGLITGGFQDSRIITTYGKAVWWKSIGETGKVAQVLDEARQMASGGSEASQGGDPLARAVFGEEAMHLWAEGRAFDASLSTMVHVPLMFGNVGEAVEGAYGLVKGGAEAFATKGLPLLRQVAEDGPVVVAELAAKAKGALGHGMDGVATHSRQFWQEVVDGYNGGFGGPGRMVPETVGGVPIPTRGLRPTTEEALAALHSKKGPQTLESRIGDWWDRLRGKGKTGAEPAGETQGTLHQPVAEEVVPPPLQKDEKIGAAAEAPVQEAPVVSVGERAVAGLKKINDDLGGDIQVVVLPLKPEQIAANKSILTQPLVLKYTHNGSQEFRYVLGSDGKPVKLRDVWNGVANRVDDGDILDAIDEVERMQRGELPSDFRDGRTRPIIAQETAAQVVQPAASSVRDTTAKNIRDFASKNTRALFDGRLDRIPNTSLNQLNGESQHGIEKALEILDFMNNPENDFFDLMSKYKVKPVERQQGYWQVSINGTKFRIEFTYEEGVFYNVKIRETLMATGYTW